jgi:hypothetical protein
MCVSSILFLLNNKDTKPDYTKIIFIPDMTWFFYFFALLLLLWTYRLAFNLPRTISNLAESEALTPAHLAKALKVHPEQDMMKMHLIFSNLSWSMSHWCPHLCEKLRKLLKNPSANGRHIQWALSFMISHFF